MALLMACMVISISCANGQTIAVFYALDADFGTLSRAADAKVSSKKVAGTTVTSLRFGSRTVAVAKMGAGCVETASSVQSVLSNVSPELVISIGPAGAISDGVPLQEWYLISSVVAYQVGTATPSGIIQKESANWKGSDGQKFGVFPEIWKTAKRVNVASGELFVASNAEREQIRSSTRAELVDMNLFGLAAVCSRNTVPWIAWKITSDRADDEAPATFKKFVDYYKGQGGTAVAEFIKQLPANPASLQSYDNIQKALQNP